MITKSQLNNDYEETIIHNVSFYIHKKINIQNTHEMKKY